MLEHRLKSSESYTLTEDDVKNVLIKENVVNYENFIYSSYDIIASKFIACMRRVLSDKA